MPYADAYLCACAQIRVLDKRNRSLVEENNALVSSVGSAEASERRWDEACAAADRRARDAEQQLRQQQISWEQEFAAAAATHEERVRTLTAQLARKVRRLALLHVSAR